MEGGWVFVEMSELVKYIARLMENEWLKFTTISSLVTGYVLNEEQDLQTLAKRLLERGVDPYVENSTYGTSPVLKNMIGTLEAAA